MKGIINSLTGLYSHLLLLYPRRFHGEFGEEMQMVFNDSLKDASERGIPSLAALCLREVVALPFNILREFWYEFERRKTAMSLDKESVTETATGVGKSRWDTSIGILPFALAGVLFMSTKFDLPFHLGYPFVVFLAVCLLGLWVGLRSGVPRWTFSYLGWSVVMSWWWTMMPVFTFTALYDPNAMPARMGVLAWIPLLIVFGFGSFAGRSDPPFRKLTSAIWGDWTLLSLSTYSFATFVLLIYDENHHPYLPAFMTAGTLVICLAVWGFLKSGTSWKRVLSLIAGFVAALVLSNISYATWDYAAYYGLPPSSPEPWYTKLPEYALMAVIWSVTIFWPAFIGLIRHIMTDRQKPGMAS